VPDLKLVRNDTNFYLEFIVKDSEGTVIDLTNATVVFNMQSTTGGSLVANITGNVTDATGGVCRFLITDELADITGEYIAEIQISYVGGRVITAPDISVKVIADLPA